jgi:hypothetical protein
MRNRTAKLATVATVLGLGGLGSVALESNQGPAFPSQSSPAAAKMARPVVTSASGAAATVPVAGTVAAAVNQPRHRPIVTRSSGGVGSPESAEFDD